MRVKIWGIIAILGMALFCFGGCSKSESKTTAGEASNHITGSLTSAISGETIATAEGITFSKKDYFYSDDTNVEILINKAGKIYYSMDGTEPTKDQTLYKDSIKLIANKDTKANCIKAKAYYEDGTESDTIIHTYFVGKNVKNRFDTLIFSVTTDPDNLYDNEYGIFVEGKLRKDYVDANPGVEIKPDAPANFNIRGMEGEREVYLEIFESNGTKVVGQESGIRSYGGWSRARAQKSIKIFARKQYDTENNKLRYEFFPNRTDLNGKTRNSFKRLVLRNCGNDNGFAFIRDELFQTLAGQAGYQDYEAVRPAAMFVNGEYRGFFWLHEVYGDDYFEDHYGKQKGSFEILEGGETYKKADSDGENADIMKDYEDMYSTYSTMDLTDNMNYDKLCKLIDVDNYLSYYALQIYLGNEDWPQNNYKTYRYYAAEGEAYGEAPCDGKWRYLLHDTDFSTGIYGTGAYVDNIQMYTGINGEVIGDCPLFGQLMRREDCKEIFIKKTIDLINGAFAPDNVATVLDQMNSERLNELSHTYNKGLLENWVSFDQLEGRLQELKTYASQRASHILIKYQEYFGLDDIYDLTVIPAEGCQVKINSYTTATDFIGSYYKNYDTILTTVVPDGKTLDYWLVNGEKVMNKELAVTSSMVKDDKVEVTVVLK